jgi:hypothetical protein
MDFLSEGNAASSKRLICCALVVVYIVQHFLIMYVKVEIPNKDLVAASQDGIKWLILAFGGFIALPGILEKMNLGGPKNVVQQDVEKQTVINDTSTTRSNGE